MAKKHKKKTNVTVIPGKDFLKKEFKKINRKLGNSSIMTDLGTAELENHFELGIEYVDSDGDLAEPGKGHKRARNMTQTTLDYLKRHGLINDEQHNAGERLYQDCYMAGFVPRAASASPDGIPHSKTNKFFSGFAEGRIDCQNRYIYISTKLSKRYVVRQRPGKNIHEPIPSNITYWDVTYKICVEGIEVTELETWTDWPRRSGKKLIGLVLDELLDTYDDIHRSRGRIPRN